MTVFIIVRRLRENYEFTIPINSMVSLPAIIKGLNKTEAMRGIDRYQVKLNNNKLYDLDEYGRQLHDIDTIRIEEMGLNDFDEKYKSTWCAMLKAGVEWFHQYPAARPEVTGQRHGDATILNDNDDAKALSKIIKDASNGVCTDKMCEAVIRHLIWIKENGLKAYMEKMWQ
jgi:hypothetical protein